VPRHPPDYRQLPKRLETFIAALENNWNRVHASVTRSRDPEDSNTARAKTAHPKSDFRNRIVLYRNKIIQADAASTLHPRSIIPKDVVTTLPGLTKI
jgi:hypothetical protein